MLAERKIKVGAIKDVSGEVTIAGGDIYKGFTAEQVSVLLTQITSTFRPKPFDGQCPYKGLDFFEEEDAELFFGRETLIDDLISRVRESRTIIITGPSGSGKSSLVRAGLIRALKKGAINSLHSERWLYETMKPGRDPIEELARVASSFAGTLSSGEDIRTKGMNDPTVLAQWCEIALKQGRDKRAVIFIDQFEEIFTQISEEIERQAFLNMLTYAATVENGRVVVLFAMRSDFVSNCATYPQLNELLNQQFIQIGAMQPHELVSAIAQPALRVGLAIDPELIAQIINDMEGEPGTLPLMQFALKDLFESEQAKGGIIALTLNEYLQRGGIHKSLERHADHSFVMLDEHEQELARSIFSGLIEVGRGTQDTRRTALFDELIPADTKAMDVQSVVQKLADARLVTTDEQAGRDTVTISHEKLIDAWPWLKKLVNENRDVIALQNEIAADASEWDNNKRDPSYLYTGARLANAREQLEAKKLVLSGVAQEFVLAGRARQRRRRILLITGVSTTFVLLIIAVIVFSSQSSANAQLAKIALARQLAAQAQTIFATGNSKQMTAVLLALQSMKMHPSDEAIQVLQNNMLARPISTMTHEHIVWAVAFSPDGKYVVSGSADHTARVWEAATGKEVARMTHDKGVNSVAFSPDGKYVVSGSADHTARVWEAATGEEVSRLTHDNEVRCVAFSPDGKYVVSGSADQTARVWDAVSGQEIARMTHTGNVRTAAFSPDGKFVVSGSGDRTARVWEAMTGEEIARMTHNGKVRSVVFSPDGKYVVSGSDDFTTRAWEAATGRAVALREYGDVVNSVGFSPDGKYIVSGNADHTIQVWDAATGQVIARMTHDNSVRSVAFSPDGKYVVSASGDFTARVWEATTGKEVIRMTHDRAKDVARNPNEPRVWSVAFSPDGKYVASGSGDFTARVWEAATGAEVARMTHENGANSVDFSPDGKYVVSGSGDHTVRVWEAATGAEVARMIHDKGMKSVAFSPDGKYVVSGSADHTARVWEAATGREVSRLTHDDEVRAVAFSPNGKYVVSGGLDHTIRIWVAETGQEVASKTLDSSVNSVAFSLDGKYIASGSGDYTARVWDAVTGQEIARMTHDSNVRSVAFSPDGKYVVSGSRDQTARVWEAGTGKEVTRIIHSSRLNSVTFSPDGKYILSGSEDNVVRVWLWRPDDLKEKACSRLTRSLSRADWRQYLRNEPYQPVCPNLPIEPLAAPSAMP